MPANKEEIEDALSEGVILNELTAPIRILSHQDKVILACVHMQLGDIVSSGRRRPEPVQRSDFSSEFNYIISAVGQQPDIPSQFNLISGPGNTIKVVPDTMSTDVTGVFAGGDVVSGPASVIEAISAGRKAAASIDKYLGGKGIIDEKLAFMENKLVSLEESGIQSRLSMPLLKVKDRINNFYQVELGYDSKMAIEETRRCLRCDLEEREGQE
jgi:NADPH-dependent glutamate synthase beta subunit-like oxidoreductase